MRKINLIASVCCASAIMIGAAVGMTLSKGTSNVKAYEIVTAEEVKEFYQNGVEFTVPEATISYGETSVAATKSVLVYPSGTVYEGGTHVLKEKGQYQLIYYATVDGKTISADVTFSVGDSKVTGEEVLPLLDETAPTLHLHTRFSDKTEHKVAFGESVTIPKATATDESPVGEVTTHVYYNYGDKNAILIDTPNGQFKPAKVGRYTIEYIVSDAYGNTAQKAVHISCGKTENNLAATLSAQDFSGEAGAELNVPYCTLQGLYEDISSVKAYAVFNGEREEITNGTFFPKSVGEYQITYELETPFKTYSTTAKLTTRAAGNSQIEKAVLPEYFIKGYSYSLDDVKGYLYNGEYPEEKVAQAYIKADGGAYTAIDHKDFRIDATSMVQFKFVCGESEIETKSFAVVDVGKGGDALKPEKYFFDKNGVFTSENTLSGIIYSLEDGEGNYELDFVNVLSLSALKFEFTVPAYDETNGKTYSEMKAVEVSVIDYYDRTNYVTACYENNGGTLTLSFNNGPKTTLARSFAGTKNMFCYLGGFTDSESGTAFSWDGAFTSDKILLSVKLVGVTGDAGIMVSRLGKQSLNSRTKSDSIAATLYVPERKNGIREINSVVELSVAQITDVLSPYCEKNLKLYVTAPNEDYATSIDGVLLNGECDVSKVYRLQLSEYGSYIVQYAYTDQNGKYESTLYAINVPERNAPTLRLKNVEADGVMEVELNTKVKVAEYEASDDVTATSELKTYVHVYAPNYQTAEIDENGYFNATREGDYIVMYQCYDAEGNCANVSYTVRVRKGDAK